MNPPSLGEIRLLAKAWIAFRGEYSDACDNLDELIREHPGSALRTIEEIHHLLISAEPRDMKAWGLLAAGPLEDLLAESGVLVISEVEMLSKQDPEFRKLLSGVWQNSMDDEIFARVQHAADSQFKFI